MEQQFSTEIFIATTMQIYRDINKAVIGHFSDIDEPSTCVVQLVGVRVFVFISLKVAYLVNDSQ
jgi:hypothetical protein